MTIDADRIAPKLYLGRYPCETEVLQYKHHFQAFIYCAKECPPSANKVLVPHQYHYGLNDLPTMSGRDIRLIEEASDFAVQLHTSGARIHFSCAMGINRSAVVLALTMMKLGIKTQDAINLIREKRNTKHLMVDRGTQALANRTFVAFLQQHKINMGW